MKKMKRFVALALSVVMVLAMSVMAFAKNDDGTYNIKAPNTNHVYKIYQIFTGDFDGTKLSNIKWGKNGTGTEGEAVAEDVINKLTAVNGKSDREILNVVKDYANLNSNAISTVTNGSSYQAAPGYYLIKDDESVATTDSYTTYIVQVVGDVTIAPKSDVPSFEKKIKDTNDTTGVTSDWQDSADYDIGDAVPFKLEGTVASNYADYKGKYYFAFHDVEETGLTFNKNSVKVYVDNTEITEGFEVKTDGLTDGCTFEVIFNNLKDITSVDAGSKIRVEYTSTLNDKAVLGQEGNVNKAKLEFSNNPNEEQEGENKPSTGETPWDNVIVFTYKVVVNKVNENKQALSGAEFTLVKNIKDTEGNVIKTEPIAVVNPNEENKTTFEFKGLDDGEYVLTETKTPSGYNTIDPITFTVNADHTITWGKEDRTTILTKLEGGNTFTGDVKTGKLEGDIVNKAGSSLPSTGGIGTTIFYIVGGILMVGAAILLITKRRAEN